jgi:hypothetical protein
MRYEHNLTTGEVTELPDLEPTPQPKQSYADLRRAEYPPIADMIDGLVKNDQEQIEAYRAACLAIKAKYPKP